MEILTRKAYVCRADLGDALKPDVFLLVLVQVILLYFAALYFVPKVIKEKKDSLTVIQGIFRSNFAVASAPMAQTMGGNGELAGEIVATTSVFCVFTLFFFVFGMSHAGLI